MAGGHFSPPPPLPTGGEVVFRPGGSLSPSLGWGWEWLRVAASGHQGPGYRGLSQAVNQPANVTLRLEGPSSVGPTTRVMTDPCDAARQSGLRGVILEWMGCLLVAQGDRTEEGTVREIQQNTVDFYHYTVLASFIFPVRCNFFRGKKTGICWSNDTCICYCCNG